MVGFWLPALTSFPNRSNRMPNLNWWEPRKFLNSETLVLMYERVNRSFTVLEVDLWSVYPLTCCRLAGISGYGQVLEPDAPTHWFVMVKEWIRSVPASPSGVMFTPS